MANKNKPEKERIAEILKWVKEQEIPDISEVLPFIPSEGITKEKRKMLAAMSIPAIARESQIIQSAYAGVNRNTWAKYANDPDFQDIVAKHLRSLLGKNAPKVFHSYVSSAYLGSPQKPYGEIVAQRQILEQTGILDAPNAPVNVTVGVEVRVEEQVKRRVGNVMERLGINGETLEEILTNTTQEVEDE